MSIGNFSKSLSQATKEENKKSKILKSTISLRARGTDVNCSGLVHFSSHKVSMRTARMRTDRLIVLNNNDNNYCDCLYYCYYY